MILTDNKRTVEIYMQVWDRDDCMGYGPDWSRDFFNAGFLPYDDETEAYFVDDVDYAIDLAFEWKYGTGDCQEDHELTEEEIENRGVFVEELSTIKYPSTDPSTDDEVHIYFDKERLDQCDPYTIERINRLAKEAMTEMQALAVPIKRMYHCIVEEGHFSFPIFLDQASGYLYVMSEEMDTYNGLLRKSEATSLEETLGEEIAAAVEYCKDGGKYDASKEDEEATWNAYLEGFPEGCRPWDEEGVTKFGSYPQEDIDWYRDSFKSGCLPPPSCLLPASDSQ